MPLFTFAILGVAVPIRAQNVARVSFGAGLPAHSSAPMAPTVCAEVLRLPVDCEPGFAPGYDSKTCKTACVPLGLDPRIMDGDAQSRRMPEPVLRDLDQRADGITRAAAAGDTSAMSDGLSRMFDLGGGAPGGAVAVPAASDGGESAALAGALRSEALEAYARPYGRPSGMEVPLPGRSALRPGARFMVAGDTDANPMRHDNTVREGAIWGAAGAIGGAGSGQVPGFVAGTVGGVMAGGADGYQQDLQDKQRRDEKTYQDGTEAARRSHEDYLRRRQAGQYD